MTPARSTGPPSIAYGLIVALVLLGMFFAGGGSASGTPATAPLGAFRYDLDVDVDYVDPALAFFTPTWQLEYATCAKLVNYPDAPAPVGSRLVPEIAAGMPTVSADGRTYTFTIRDDFWFSPPATGQRVTAQSMKYTFERTLHRLTSSPAQPFYRDIVGARAFIDGDAEEITGIVAQGDTLTITLVEPAGDFLARVALPFMCAVPPTLPRDPDGVHAPVPSAGPYYISAWSPRQSLVALRNPNYAGPRPRHFDSIEYTIGFPPATTMQRILDGLADHGPVPPAAHEELDEQYGPDSTAAQRGWQQWFANPVPAVRYLAMNTERPLFANVDLRRAVNYAIDRRALVALRGHRAGKTNEQLVPLVVPGFLDEDIYPVDGPDVETARELTGWEPGEPRRPGVLYTCTAVICMQSAQLVRENLLDVGFDMEIRSFPRAEQFTRTGCRSEPFDMTLEGWFAEYFDPFSFLRLIDGTSIHDGCGNINFSYCNDVAFNERLHGAQFLTGDARLDSLAELDVDAARDIACLAPYMNDNDRDFFSRRIGCQIRHPMYDTNLAALCVRPAISIDDVRVTEPASGTASAVFTVQLSSEESSPVTVAFETVDESATGGADYVAASGVLTFAANQRTKTVTVPISADGTSEPEETLALVLSNQSSGTIVDGRGTAAIVDPTWSPPPVEPPPVEPPPVEPPPVGPPPAEPPPAEPPPPPITRRCVVPRVVGKRLVAARAAIRRARCSVGRVRRARSRKARGRVIAQSPRPGARRLRGARVNLVVSRGRR